MDGRYNANQKLYVGSNMTEISGTLVLVAIWAVTLPSFARGVEGAAEPKPCAHAHNDFLNDRPLLDALEYGACSVEVDIFLVDGRVLVGHEREKLHAEETLTTMYLEPLRRRIERHGGRVFRKGRPLILLIDIKSDGSETYRALRQVLTEYKDILGCMQDNRMTAGAITVVISGNRAIDRISVDKLRCAGIDGRLSDLDSRIPSHLMPLISDNWKEHFEWRGEGIMPKEERTKLREIVRKAHRVGRMVRFWAAPDNAAVWDELYRAGVDLINSDRLDRLASFLLLKKEEEQGGFARTCSAESLQPTRRSGGLTSREPSER
ncbi:MAG: hypothetical protein BMS9Abin37_1098 [Acidobacteriota bacterium]|nr:MAG: hypothetical protein BMS9Abin37_1098 [Acidobacteriota bacterium]